MLSLSRRTFLIVQHILFLQIVQGFFPHETHDRMREFDSIEDCKPQERAGGTLTVVRETQHTVLRRNNNIYRGGKWYAGKEVVADFLPSEGRERDSDQTASNSR